MYNYLFSYTATTKEQFSQQCLGHITYSLENKISVNDIEHVLDSIEKTQNVEKVVIRSISLLDGDTRENENEVFFILSIASINENNVKYFKERCLAYDYIKEIADELKISMDDENYYLGMNWWKFPYQGVDTEFKIHRIELTIDENAKLYHKSWLDKYIDFKQKVIKRIQDIVGEKTIEMEGYENCVKIQDDFSGEYLDFDIISVNKCFVNVSSKYDDNYHKDTTKDLDDLDANELVAICDFLEKKEK